MEPLTPRALERRLKRYVMKERHDFLAVTAPGFERVLLAEVEGLPGVTDARAQEPSHEAIVDAMEKVSGTHAGKRRSGAKGVCAAGEFVSNGAGARLTKAAPFQPGDRAPVVARFSNGGGNPRAPDNAPAVRGMSLSFALPSDSFEMVMINAPAFALQEVRLNVVGTTPKGIVQSHAMRWQHIGRNSAAGFGEAVTMVATPLYSNTTLVSFLPTIGCGGTAVHPMERR